MKGCYDRRPAPYQSFHLGPCPAARPPVIDRQLADAYRQMAEDEAREREALDWAEATIGDMGDAAW